MLMSRNSDPVVPKDGNITNINVTVRSVARTPSPTPSELETLNSTNHVSIQKVISNWKYVIPLAILVIVIIVILALNKHIVHALQPAGNDLRKLKAGWLIPIAILFVLSFPPLFGHEIVHLLVGLVYGLGTAFGIVAAGTLLGELANFYAFRYLFSSRAEKLEKRQIQYACLARVVRSGGFWTALVIRYSAIPGHFTTIVFSVTGMNVLTFTAAAILSLPKQFATVYIGHVLKEENNGSSSKDKEISVSVVLVTIAVTSAAMWYLRKQINVIKHEVIYERRKARQFDLQSTGPSENQTIIQAPAPRYLTEPSGAGNSPQEVGNTVHVGNSTQSEEQGEEMYRLVNLQQNVPPHLEDGNGSYYYYDTLKYPLPSYPPNGYRN